VMEVMGVGPMCLLYFYHMYIHAMQKYFYDTIKYKKMNDVFLYFYASIGNISYGVFTLHKNYFHEA
jgi:hypothetical protein